MSEGSASRAQTGAASLSGAAERVAERVIFIRFTRAVKATAVPAIGAALLLVGAAAYSGWFRHELGLSLGVIFLWLLGCWVYAVLRRSAPFAALAFWDEATGRKELFASAWSFLREGGGDVPLNAGQALHVQRAVAVLDPALGSLHADLPLARVGWRWLLPVALVALAASPWGKPQVPPWEQQMGEGMLEEASEQAGEVASASDSLDSVEGLEPDEKEKLDALQEAVESMAEELSAAGGKTAEEVLDALESRAREAEDLASELGESDDAWASEGLLAALGEHADTADLADAIRDKNASQSADESREVSGILRSPDLTAEVRNRFETTLDRAAERADDADRNRPVGKHVSAASEALQKRAAPAAGTEFAELAKHFEELERRENAREALEALADALRDAGSAIAGQGNSGMEKLAGNESGDPGAGAGGAVDGMEPLEFPEGMGSPQTMPLSAPGMDSLQPPSGSGQGQPGQIPIATGTPVPGEPGDGTPEAMALVPGEGAGEGGMMALLPAPIPGTQPGGAIAAPVPGAPGPVAMPGGLEAGSGTAGLGDSASAPTAAAQQGTVAAQVNSDGESTVRAVEGSPHQELATRSRQDVAIEFLGVQEDALDDQPLPPARKEQVKRYFRAVRESFERTD